LSIHWNLFMNPKIKTFDCVTESRRWREAASAKLHAMSMEEELAHFSAVGERLRSLLGGQRGGGGDEGAVLREEPKAYGNGGA
jgi:hypothetical protein